MHKGAGGEDIKHIYSLWQNHEFEIRCVYIGLSDICMFCSQNQFAFIVFLNQNRLPTAELDCHLYNTAARIGIRV